MNTSLILVLALLLPLQNAKPEPMPLSSMIPGGYREEIYKGESQLGFVAVSSQTIEKNGKKIGFRLQKETNLTLQRFGSLVSLRMIEMQEMDLIGTVHRISMKQYQGPKQTLDLSGQRDGNSFRVWVGNNSERTIPWDIDGFGPLGKEQMISGKKWEHDEHLQFDCYQAIVNRFVTYDVVATKKTSNDPKDPVAWTVLMSPKKIIAGDLSLQLPKTLYFLDQNQNVLFAETEMDGIGEISLVRSKSTYIPNRSAKQIFDIGKASYIQTNRRLNAARSSLSNSYLISIPDLQGGNPLVEDERQKIVKKTNDSFMLEVRAFRLPDDVPASVAPNAEEMAPSKYIDWNNPAIKNFSREVNFLDIDPWRKSIMLEKLVRHKMMFDNQQPFSSASEIAKNPRGDCRHAAILLAALCRSEGVPSRIAHGLIYIEKNGVPMFGFHMWTEAHVRGRWVALDGTMGLGFVGADHIKISHHTYNEIESLAPIATLHNFIGKAKIQVD
ncbi:MAG: hypothetical protein EBT92_15345 [Planctomycetes bacterium]|nr:hypothetical protein [Planctomycetota bacterium]